MHKISSLLVLVALMVSVAACGGESATPTSLPAPATATTTTAMVETPTTAAMANTPTTAAMAVTPTTAAAGTTPTAAAVLTGTTTAGTTPTVEPVKDPAAAMAAIKQRGKVIIGVKYDVPTFGYLNPTTNKVEGFDVEMGRAVSQQIFGNPDSVQFVEAKSANRIPYLNDGTADVIFSTMTANETRAQQIDFSDCYYVAGQSLLVPAGSAISSVNDLAGKTVGTAKGSTSEQNIRKFAPQAKVELFGGYAEAVQAMQSGRVDVVTTDDIILLGFVKQSPDKFKVVGGQFTQEPYAAGVKKGNTELLGAVNAAVRDQKQS
ncbi:MAG TPA: glutamate ABC transporter substrate-binding protein, partial [Chloroflexia bacterium]|nr:glutamate ABC transporter substrate-binding protein [Chloroflexia bacterium]